MSFPRDLLVDIPGHGKGKINAAFDLGGGPAAARDRDAGSELPGAQDQPLRPGRLPQLPVGRRRHRHRRRLLPAEHARLRPQPQRGATELRASRPGCAKLNGVTALQYVRSRHLQEQDPVTLQWTPIGADAPDIHRIERQQAFIRELAGIAIDQSLSDPFTALDVADRRVQLPRIDGISAATDLNQLVRAFRTVDVNDPNSVEFTTIPWAVNPLDRATGRRLVLEATRSERPRRPARDVRRQAAAADILPSQVHVRVIDATGTGIQTAVAGIAREGRLPRRRHRHREVPGADDRHPLRPQPGWAAAKLLLDYFPDARLVPDPSRSTVSSSCSAPTSRARSRCRPRPPPSRRQLRRRRPRSRPRRPLAPAPTTTTLALGSAC